MLHVRGFLQMWHSFEGNFLNLILKKDVVGISEIFLVKWHMEL